MSNTKTEAKTELKAYNGHAAECLCERCCMADMSAHIKAMGWTERSAPVAPRRLDAGPVHTVAPGIVASDRPRFGERLASDKQTSFLRSLIERKGYTKAAEGMDGLTSKQASALIDTLLRLDDKPRAAPVTPVTPVAAHAPVYPRPNPLRVPLEDGMYLKDGQVIKVQHAVNGSGRQYAKFLEGTSFVFAPCGMRGLTPEHKMTLEQAKEYGALYGVCCRCGRTLTDENSIAEGIGPICASKF